MIPNRGYRFSDRIIPESEKVGAGRQAPPALTALLVVRNIGGIVPRRLPLPLGGRTGLGLGLAALEVFPQSRTQARATFGGIRFRRGRHGRSLEHFPAVWRPVSPQKLRPNVKSRDGRLRRRAKEIRRGGRSVRFVLTGERLPVPSHVETSAPAQACGGRACASPTLVARIATFRRPRSTRPAGQRCRSSVVEHSLGKGEVDSSILSGSTTKPNALSITAHEIRRCNAIELAGGPTSGSLVCSGSFTPDCMKRRLCSHGCRPTLQRTSRTSAGSRVHHKRIAANAPMPFNCE